MNKQLLKKSVDNIRLKQIQDKVNLESNISWANKTIGSLIPVRERMEYMQKLGRDFMQQKVSLLW